MYVFDATPLIYLGKAERLPLVEKLPERCVVPDPIHEEVVATGLADGHADARRVERAIDDEILSVVSVDTTSTYERLCENQHLSDADAAVLAVADAHDAVAVMDEQYGRDVASAEGIETKGTAFLVLSVLKDGGITDEEAQATVDAMVDAGWYCSPDLYARLSQKIDELS
jgi:predicted nucleic acid-binding protein